MKKSILIIALSILGMTMSLSSGARNDGKFTVGLIGGTNLFHEPAHAPVGSAWAFFPGGTVFLDYSVANFAGGHFTVGAQAGFQSWRNNHLDWSVAPRLTLGWDLTDRAEVHLGVNGGLGLSNWRGGKGNVMGFSYSAFAGFQFLIADGFGLTLEGGYSQFTPDLNVGVFFRF